MKKCDVILRIKKEKVEQCKGLGDFKMIDGRGQKIVYVCYGCRDLMLKRGYQDKV